MVKGIYIRTKREDINTLLDIMQRINISSSEIVEVKKDTFSNEQTLIGRVSRKIYAKEKLIYIKCDKRVSIAHDLLKLSKIKFEFFLEENLSI